jgi:exopolyphosphatase/guanosine-5'-triphosphate,3'-diphosphate pyrophosphatase
VSRGDREAVAGLLGRAPQGAFEIVVRDAAGGPVVIRNSPLLDDGTPMPTRYWLVGRSERESVSRLESAGGVRAAEAAVDAAALELAHARYEALREASMPPGHLGPRPTGGVGGTRRGVKCLHAHLAWYLAGGPDPVGQWTCDKLGIERSAYRVTAAWESAPPHGGAGDHGGPVAAIDCGTNSTRLLVADAAGRSLERLMRITRLGQDVDRSGRLAEEAMRRTIEVLAEFRRVMGDHGVVRARATATSAARDAENAGEFARRVTEVLGIAPEVLPGEEEARLAYLGATAELDPAAGPYLVIDVGGGSTELVGGAGAGLEVVSLEIGCVRATERFLRHDPPLPTELAAARTHVRGLVTAALDAHPALEGAARLVGVAGTVAALARLDQGLVEYDRSRIHHARVSLAAIEQLIGTLGAVPAASRAEWPALEPERADVLIGGAAVIAEAMVTLGFDELTASESDLLDGIVADLLAG